MHPPCTGSHGTPGSPAVHGSMRPPRGTKKKPPVPHGVPVVRHSPNGSLIGRARSPLSVPHAVIGPFGSSYPDARDGVITHTKTQYPRCVMGHPIPPHAILCVPRVPERHMRAVYLV